MESHKPELDAQTPKVTLAVVAYGQEAVIRETITAAFAQACDNLEILLSDDASPDRTFDIMCEMASAYRGPHRIKLNRNPQNLGLIGHVNKVFELAGGDLIVANAGDDISLPERCATLWNTYQKNQPALIYSDHIAMEVDGTALWSHSRKETVDRYKDIAEKSCAMASVIGATCAWSRKLIDVFGPITEALAYEDAVFFSRASLLDAIEHVPLSLVKYRKGGHSRGEHSLEFRIRSKEVAAAVMRQRKKDVASFANWLTSRIDEEHTAIETRLTQMKKRQLRMSQQQETQETIDISP